MSISMKQAILFVPSDSGWINKTLLGGLLLFFPVFAYVFPGIRRLIFSPINYYALALFLMLTLVVSIIMCGYFFKAVHNRIVHEKETMPSWHNYPLYWVTGVKAYCGGFVLSLSFIFLNGIVWTFAPMSICKDVLPFIAFSLILHIIYSFLYTMMALNFSRDFNIASFWDFKKAWNLISGNVINYILLVLNCLLVAFIHLVVIVILINAQIFSLLLPFISFYVFMIYADLFAQFALNKMES